MPPIDLALLLVKSYQTTRAAPEIEKFLAPHGLAVTLQNGLGNAEILATVLGSHRVTQGITSVGATMLEPGRVRFAGHGPTHLPRSAGNQEIIGQFAAMLRTARFETHLSNDLNSLTWGKLVINTAINPLTALLRVPNGFLAEDDRARTLLRAAAEETAAVAHTLDITLPYPDPSLHVLEVARATAKNRSSMLQDILRGSRTEIDAICGAVLRHAQQAGIQTPINAEYLRLIHTIPTLKPGEVLTTTIEPLKALLGYSSQHDHHD